MISVIIPLYNHQDTVIDSIRSILNQTYKNIEIIVVDDCSTDNSYTNVNEFISGYNKDNGCLKIALLKTKINMGCYAARNLGIINSTGEYIAFQDPDDFSLSNRFEIQMAIIKRKNIKICFCNYYRFRNNKIDYSEKDSEMFEQINKDNSDSEKHNFMIAMATSIIDKSLFTKHGLYQHAYRYSMDTMQILKFYCAENNMSPYNFGFKSFCMFMNNNGDKSKLMFKTSKVLYVANKYGINNLSEKYKNSIRNRARKRVMYEINIYVKNLYPQITEENICPQIVEENICPQIAEDNIYPQIAEDNICPQITEENIYP